MKTYLKLKNKNNKDLPNEFKKEDDVRLPEELVKIFIEEFTKEGEIIFDPFAGFGTTLRVAEEMKRIAYGIELMQDRVKYIQDNIYNKDNIINGNSLELDKFNIPMIDFSLTSPPYMSKNNHLEYPFAGYQITGDGYEQYLIDIKSIYSKLKKHLKPGAYVVIEISNIINREENTTLAWDVAKEVSKILKFEKEIIVCWENDTNKALETNYGFGYDHSYCLIFKNI